MIICKSRLNRRISKCFTHRSTAGRFAKQRDGLRIGSEVHCVFFDPLDSQRLIPQSHIAGSVVTVFWQLRGQVHGPEGPEPVLHGRYHHIERGRQQVAVIDLQRRSAGHITTTVNPHQHWYLQKKKKKKYTILIFALIKYVEPVAFLNPPPPLIRYCVELLIEFITNISAVRVFVKRIRYFYATGKMNRIEKLCKFLLHTKALERLPFDF